MFRSKKQTAVCVNLWKISYKYQCQIYVKQYGNLRYTSFNIFNRSKKQNLMLLYRSVLLKY